MACNICGAAPAVPSSEDAAPSDICPQCELRVRHRAVHDFLAKSPEVQAILENGPTLFCHMTPKERKYLFSGCQNFINFDIRPMKYLDLTMDIQDMHRISTGSVDGFVAIHVLNHVPNDGQAIGEVARVLRPATGIFLMTVPIRRSSRTTAVENVTQHYGEAALKEYGVGSFRFYGLRDLLAQLEPHFLVRCFDFVDPMVTATEIVLCCHRKGTLFDGLKPGATAN